MQLIPEFKIGIPNAWIFAVCFFLPPYLLMLLNKKAYNKGGNPPNVSKGEKIIGYIATIIIYIAYLYSIFLSFKLETAWFYTGLFIFLIAVTILVIAGINFATTPIEKPATKGIYRYSRHPVYLSNFLALIGIGISTASWVILLAAIMFFILVSFVASSEEQHCKEKYGDIYKEYLNKTPRWIGTPKS